ncbi:hypothetical protein [Acetobacter sp.]|uniref:hypothetical protein n=1 Tax=Acetobacter sp. TaxID=440 RepID=UPI0039EB1051
MKNNLKSAHIRALDYLTRVVPGLAQPEWRKPGISFARCCSLLWRERRELVQFDQEKGYCVTSAGAAVAAELFVGSAAA